MDSAEATVGSAKHTPGNELSKRKHSGWCTAVLVGLLVAICVLIGTVALMHHIVDAPTAERLEAPDCLVVRTSSGRVRGTVVEFSINGTQYSTVAFYGIPFARPPAGSRRFMMPASARPWKAVFNATQKRPPCKQLHTRFPKNYVINASNTTEECLHINIWVPGRCVDPTSMRAAMFWLYGGSFAHGGNSYDFYDGRFVSALGDLVVAAPNYRVSLFGFLNSGTGHVEGNMGLHDQVLALRWVRENIGRFGGDRGNVLLAGNSAGSISLSLLMASPLGSPHTFRRLYLMSGSMYTPMPDNEGDRARRTFDAIADAVDCRSENATMSAVVRCLQGQDASALLEASKNFSLNLMPSREGPLLPVGNFRLGDRDFGHLEVIFTTTLNEGMAFFELMFPQFQGRKQTDAKETVNEALRGRLGNFTDEMADFMLDILRHALYDIDDPDYAGWANLIGDVLIRCPTERLASDLSKRGAQVYYQVYEPKLSFTTFGGAKATHGEDVLIMFGAPYLYPFLATDDERSMSQRMIETLANFTLTGSLPSLVDGTAWPRFYNGSSQDVVLLTHEGYNYSSPSRDCSVADLVGGGLSTSLARGLVGPKDARLLTDSLMRRYMENRLA